ASGFTMNPTLAIDDLNVSGDGAGMVTVSSAMPALSVSSDYQDVTVMITVDAADVAFNGEKLNFSDITLTLDTRTSWTDRAMIVLVPVTFVEGPEMDITYQPGLASNVVTVPISGLS